MFFLISDKIIGAMYQIAWRHTPGDTKLETRCGQHLVCYIYGQTGTEQLTRRHNPQDRILNLIHFIRLRQLDV
jgi:hypothetical protein